MRTITAQPLPEWESLPDFGLYMDQLLIFTERYLPGGLTAGMVNSYVKNGLVKRPVGKKYDKESLAQILMTGILKAVLPLETLRQLLHSGGDTDARALYGQFLRELERIEAEQVLHPETNALDCALRSACDQQRCCDLLAGRAETPAAGGQTV